MSKTGRGLVFLALICFLSASCQIAEKLIDSRKKIRNEIVKKTYEKDGLSFSYPDNWQVTEDEILEEGARYLNIEDSENSLFIITLTSSKVLIDLDEYAENFKSQLPSSTAVGKISGWKTTRTSRVSNGNNYQGVRQRYTISLIRQSVPHTTDFFSIEGEKFNAIVTIQAPDEDWAAAEKEFQVIFDSLKF